MRLHIIAVCLAVLPAPALAQIGNPAMMAPETQFEAPGKMAPNQTNATDRLFARLTTEGGLAEVSFGELAVARAQTPAVGDFARRMIEDHTAANDRLASVAEKSRIPLPDELNAEHAAMLEALKKLDGAAFDLAYMQGQIVDHQKTTLLLLWEIDFGQDPKLKRFASETLPTVLDHLAMAREIAAELARAQVAQAAPSPVE